MKREEIKEILDLAKKEIVVISNKKEKINLKLESLYSKKKKTEEELKEEIWKNAEYKNLLKNIKQEETILEDIIKEENTHTELLELFTLLSEDESELSILYPEIKNHLKKIQSIKTTLLLNHEDDQKACFLDINAGAGGTEAQDWASMLLRMYTRYCEQHNFSYQVVDLLNGEEAGIKSATLLINGNFPYGFLKGEAGIHRLVRISPFDSNKKRHTSFASVFVQPEVEDIKISINTSDLRIDTFRAGGAGGQHVNKTDSAVRITHIPSGIVTQCQNERSQNQNKDVAMKMLKSKLYLLEKERQTNELNSIEKRKIEWGSQIRSYVLHPYKMVKDHRTDLESPQPDLVLDGHLEEFIESYLINNNSEN